MDFSTLSSLVLDATGQTLVMVLVSTFFSLVLGLPLGILLCVTDPAGGIMPRRILYQVLTRIVNALRSFPFIILMILLFPLSRFIIGTSIGTAATIVPLSIAAAPFVARIIETALKEVDPGVVQAARAMGSTNLQIIVKVLLPEALPSLVSGVTLTIINLIGYSAMAGAIGGGGLGDLAIRYGYQRFRPEVMVAAVVIILLLVEVIQLVAFDTEAWHAGISAYAGRKGLNRYSIGIELDNLGRLQVQDGEFLTGCGRVVEPEEVYVDKSVAVPTFWHRYTPVQLDRLREVCRLLCAAYPVRHIVGHSDITDRKQDPGPEIRALLRQHLEKGIIFNR